MHIPPYYELFGLPVRLDPDPEELRRRFLALNRSHHPDRFTLESEEKQAEALARATEINRAYQTISDENARLRYVLSWYGELGEEGQEKMDPEFLMEMMEANEKIAELELESNDRAFADISNLLADKEKELRESVLPSFSNFDGSPETRSALKNVKDYFLKTRYLLRIRENLLRFAPD